MQTPGLEKQFFPETILSPRVTLKRHELSMADTMFQHIDHDRNRLREFLPWVDFSRTVADTRAYIQLTHDKWSTHELFDFGIYQNSDGAYLGNIGIHQLSWAHRKCEIGYWILGPFEGRGIVSEAVRALEKTIFDLGFHRVEIRCSSRNTKSSNVPKRCGYAIEGVLRGDAIEQGRYRDTLVFAKLKDESSSKLFPIRLQPIGRVQSSRKEAMDDQWDSVTAVVHLDATKFSADALLGLDTFSHVEVIFQMDQVDPAKIESGARHPRNHLNWPKVGIFAQRGRNRPNQIGTTVCKIKSVSGLEVHLEGLDAIDGTPVLDLKPWVNEFAPRGVVHQPAWISELMMNYWS